MARIILASGSPRRQELLQRIGLREFEISVPDVEEWYPPELMPEDIVAYISREKSQAVQAPADAIVITADTMVFLDDQRLGKPHDEAEALSMLTALSGRKHRVCTGVTARQGEKALTRAQSTDVYFREASRQELLAYIRGGEPMDKAGAYGVQGQGALLVERIDGDFFNVMGLPVVLLRRMLAEIGVPLLAFYCIFGDILSNLIWCGMMIWLSFCSIRGLVCANGQTGAARNMRWFHIGVLCFVASEYLLWTVGCFWPDTSPASPTFWCDMLLTLAIFGLLPAARKAVEA